MSSEKTVRVERDDALAIITLAAPDRHNAITGRTHHALKEAFLDVRGDRDVRAIVFASEGQSFSAGGDFDEILADRVDRDRRLAMQAEGKPLLMAIADCQLPVVTALQGDAVGLGATLVLASDAVFASRTAHISDPHVVIGLAAGDGGCVAWPAHAGLLRAKRYLLSGDRIGAEAALAMGLVTDLVDTPAESLPAATAYARRLAALPPMAVQNTKRVLNSIFRARVEATFDYGLALEMECFTSDDVEEAIGAFRERRVPRYRGT